MMQSNTKKKIASIAVTVLVVLYIAPVAFFAVYAAIGLAVVAEIRAMAPFLVMYTLIGGAVIVGVLMALAQRLREIDGGEEDEAKKY